MQKTLYLSVIILLLTSLGLSACKKQSSRRDILIGSWDQEGYANNTLNFNSDGTGKQIDPVNGNFDFTWNLTDGDNSILLDGNTANSFTWKIRELSSGRFTFQDVSSGYIYTFTR